MCDKQTCLSTPSVPAPIFALSAPSSSLFPPPLPLFLRGRRRMCTPCPHIPQPAPLSRVPGGPEGQSPPPLPSRFTPPPLPALSLSLRVEGAGNPLCPVPRAPRAFPFPWHEEGCPGPPPLPPVHAPRRAFTPHLALTRREGWNPPTPQPPSSLPRPMHASPICAQEFYAKGWRARGRAWAEQRSNKHNKWWGEHRHQCGSSAATQPRPGRCTRTEGQGCREGFGGRRRAMMAPPHVHRG